MMPMRVLLIALLMESTVLGFSPLSPSAAAVHRDGTRLQMSLPTQIDTLTSGLASTCRLPGGITVIPGASKLTEEEKPNLKQLFDVETSRTCRKVRERISELDLVVDIVIPAASNSRVFTDSAYDYALPQGTVIPRLVLVEASGEERVLSGDEAILAYLDKTFLVPALNTDDTREQAISILREAGGYVADFLRIGRGSSVSPVALGATAPRPARPLVLYSYEGNQFCRLVREVFTELDIPYELRSAGKESPRRKELEEVSGATRQPYLIDPNTGEAMPESLDIIRYLYKTYALWTPPNEILEWASATVLPPVKLLFATQAPLQAGSGGEDKTLYEKEISEAKTKIEAAIKESPVVVYTYDLSPFSFETKALLDNIEISYKEISLGKEWIPGLISEGGSQTRAALLDMTGQSSLPHVFIGGKSIGGLFSGTPGLIPALEQGSLREMVSNANTSVAMADPVQVE